MNSLPSIHSAVIVGNDIDVPFRLVEVLPGRFHDSPFVVDVEFTSISGETIRGQGRVDIQSYNNEGFDRDSHPSNEDIRIHNLTIRDGANDSYAIIPFIRTVSRDVIQASSGIITSGFGSQFLSAAQSLILYPTTRTAGRLIIRPTDPTRYVMDGVFRYMSANPEIITTIISTSATIPPLVLDTTRMVTTVEPRRSMTFIHSQAWMYLHDEVERIVSIIGRNFQFTLQDESVLERFPLVQFTITNPADGGEPFNLVMYPRDYVKKVGTDQYRVYIGCNNDSFMYIGNDVLRTMALHVDNINQRYGFGESLHSID